MLLFSYKISIDLNFPCVVRIDLNF